MPISFAVAATSFYFASPQPLSMVPGFSVAALGLLVRAWATGVIRKDSALATTGPYAYTRNPLYFGSFLLAAGFAIAGASVVSALLLLVPFAVIYPGLIRREERHLEELFGDQFLSYRRRVPRFFPRAIFWQFRPAFSWPQFRANREYNASLGFAVAVGLFVAKWMANR